MTSRAPQKASLEVTRSPESHLVTLSRADHEEYLFTVERREGETLEPLLERAGRLLVEREARVIELDLLGLCAEDDVLERHLGPVEWPVTRVLNGQTPTDARGGLFLHAVSKLQVEPIRRQGRVIGVRWSDAFADYCRLGGFRLRDESPVAEARADLGLMESTLASLGMTFHHVARTWFFFDSILSWYDDFNLARKSFFHERGLLGGLIPASTGIGGPNPDGTALETGLLAIRAKQSGDVSFRALPSPLQCSACDYGSFFSRAVEVKSPDHRRVLVSGTASIDAGGNCVHDGDHEAQIDLTMRVVGAILESQNMSFADVTRAYAYFKDNQCIEELTDLVRRWSHPDMPMLVLQNDVCFEPLLFEIELDAVRCDS